MQEMKSQFYLGFGLADLRITRFSVSSCPFLWSTWNTTEEEIMF